MAAASPGAHAKQEGLPVAPSESGTRRLHRVPIEQLAFCVCAALVLFLLFYRLGQVPAGLYHDETITGYDARSIDRNLSDHFGVRLPLFFESFYGDYKSPIYIYLAAVNELLLGSTPFALRLTSTELVLGLALCVFFLLRMLTGDQVLARWMALFTLLVPSVFFYARVATAENVSFAFMLALALNFLLIFERRPSWRTAVLAGALLAASSYTYHVAHLLAPVMVVVAATSYFFDPRTRRYLSAFLASAAAVGAPMAIFMLRHPDSLTHRFNTHVGVWRDHPGLGVVADRILSSYFTHLASLDFLFRTGQHQLTSNMGAGLLPTWLWLPMLLGLGALWQRRRSAFARFLLVMVFLSPIPVALTWENLPHTARIFHLIVFLLVAAGLAISDWLSIFHPPRWLVALGIAGIFIEGAQDASLYFGDYAAKVRRERPFEDGNNGEALQIAFAFRHGEEPLYLPSSFFQTSGTFIEFYGDLDPQRIRSVGLQGTNILDSEEQPIDPRRGGLLVAVLGSEPPVPADLIGTTKDPEAGGPTYQVYRIRSEVDFPGCNRGICPAGVANPLDDCFGFGACPKGTNCVFSDLVDCGASCYPIPDAGCFLVKVPSNPYCLSSEEGVAVRLDGGAPSCPADHPPNCAPFRMPGQPCQWLCTACPADRAQSQKLLQQ